MNEVLLRRGREIECGNMRANTIQWRKIESRVFYCGDLSRKESYTIF